MKHIRLFEEFSNKIDMKGRPCQKCEGGTYKETSLHDDLMGVLHCDKCEHRTDRYKENFEEGVDYFHSEEPIEERAKSQRYKGRKIPGKYLAGPQPGKMKKEIDKFRGKSEYKKDWDADYYSGKGGKGKRVKTKKSAASKAYQRMFGKS